MLNLLPAALIISNRLTARESGSALPNSPVQAGPPAPALRTVRTRRAVATALHRAANVVSPA